MKKHFVYLLLCMLVFAGCQKSQERSALSLESKEKRLCQEWKLDKFTFNDEAITNEANQKWIFEENRTLTIVIINEDSSNKIEFDWRWVNNNESIEIQESTSGEGKAVLFNLNREREEDWIYLKIKKMNFDQIILERHIESDIIRFEFTI